LQHAPFSGIQFLIGQHCCPIYRPAHSMFPFPVLAAGMV
jgi:hypothetical protein